MENKTEHNLATIFGNRLSQLRKNQNLTQAELAEKLGYSRSMIAYVESSAKNPTLETVQRVADFFGVSPEKLLCEESSKLIKPGPDSRLVQQVNRLKNLSVAKQKLAAELLEAFIQNA